MSALQVFVLSMLIGLVGFFGYTIELLQGRVTRFTRWSDLSNRQWTFVYMVLQFVAALVVGGLYLIFKA